MRAKGITIVFIILMLSLVLPSQAFSVDSTDYTYTTGNGTWTQLDENTYTMDTDSDGSPDVTLTKNGDTWTYEFAVEDDTKNYYVYETMKNGLESQGYTTSGEDGTMSVEKNPGTLNGSSSTTKSFTITNSKTHDTAPKTGSLKITKTVSGSATTKKFAFDVSLSVTTDKLKTLISGSKIFGDVPFQDGKATVSLGNGEEKEITGIPEGVSYSVEEREDDNFTQTSSGVTGTITADSTSTASFTNTAKEAPKSGSGELTIGKDVIVPDGIDADQISTQIDSQSYVFHVMFTNLDKETQYSLGDIQFESDSDGTADVEFQMKRGDRKSIVLPEDATYRVTEESGKYTASYSINDANGKDIRSSQGSVQEGEQLSTETEKVSNDTDATVLFSNEIDQRQTIKLNKNVVNILGFTTSEDKDASGNDIRYEFECEFSNLGDSTTIQSTLGEIQADQNGDATVTVYLKNGEEVDFTDVPVGSTYTFTEKSNDKYAHYKIASNGTGTIVSKAHDNVSRSTDLSTENETVDYGEDQEVQFSNSPQAVYLPTTGGNGLMSAAMTTLCTLVACFMFYLGYSTWKRRNPDKPTILQRLAK